MQEMNVEGLVFSHDPRDADFAFSKLVTQRPPYTSKEWWPNGWWGNQGQTPHCCAFSWTHFLEDGPVVQDAIVNRPVPLITPAKFFEECKKIDGLPATSKGTTIRAGATVAKRLGLISEYRWAFTLEEAIDALLIFGPVIAGTTWYTGMTSPKNGIMSATGDNIGGHAYIINGVDTVKKQFRMKNSYGKSWGKNGFGYIPFDDMKKLLKESGPLCVPFEVKVDKVPQL